MVDGFITVTLKYIDIDQKFTVTWRYFFFTRTLKNIEINYKDTAIISILFTKILQLID